MYCCILWAGCGRNVAATSRVIGGLNLCPIADRNSINIAYSPASKSARCVGVTTGCGSSSRLPMSALDIIADVLDRSDADQLRDATVARRAAQLFSADGKMSVITLV